MKSKKAQKRSRGIRILGTVEIIIGILQLLIGIFYLLYTFIAVKTGNIPSVWIGQINLIYQFSYVYIVYGILELIGGIGILNLNNASRYLIIGVAGIKVIYIFTNSIILRFLGKSGYKIYSIIYSLYYLFVIFFLLSKKKSFKK